MNKSVIAIIPTQDKFVAILSRKFSRLPVLPGGKVESSESLEQALLRETFKKTGITCVKYFPIYEQKDPSNNFLCTVFVVKEYILLGGDNYLKSSNEGAAILLSKEELLTRSPYKEWYVEMFNMYNYYLISEKRNKTFGRLATKRVGYY